MTSEYGYIRLVIFHLIVGALFFYVPFFPRLYFYLVVAFFVLRIIVAPHSGKNFEVIKACAYVVGIEVLFRMTDAAIFYEASKYLVILFVLIGMFYRGVSGKGYPYFIYLIALVPSVVVASTVLGYDANFRTNIAFVLSGPVCLGLATLFCYDKKITHKQLMDVIMYMGLPVISMTVYVFLYTPDLKDILSGTESNYMTSGGFGPNQTCTIFGLGMFAMVVRFFLASPSLLSKMLNLILFAAISYRAVITFSRGGVFAAIIVIAGFLMVLYFRSNYQQKNRIISSFFVFLTAISVTWVISSANTQGLIDKRYAGQDALGREKEDISTGRVDLFLDELQGFIENPFVGVGASGMKEKRLEEQGKSVVSHNEISRLLSEHGFVGILILMILIVKPLGFRTQNSKSYFFYAFFFFWFATINHSAMRIAAPAYLYALALLNVVNEKHLIHRKLSPKKAS